jgi:hypothetical protein
MTVHEFARRHLYPAFPKERQEVHGAALGQDDELVALGERLDGLERANERLRRRKAPEVENVGHGSPAVL